MTINKSGYQPLNEELIVHVYEALEGIIKDKNGDYRRGSEHGLIIPFNALESEAFRATTGIVVEMGENTFPTLSKAPTLGEILVFKPYAGTNICGDDGEWYRILTWKEIRAIYKPQQ